MNRFTVCGESKAEITVERSRFLAVAAGVTDEKQAAEFVAGVAKRFYDATHNCYAFSAGGTKRFSDDGEPSGTADLCGLIPTRRRLRWTEPSWRAA